MLVNIIQNTISSFRSALAAAEVITTNLKMWLGFETSETLGRELVVDGDFPSRPKSHSKGLVIAAYPVFVHPDQTPIPADTLFQTAQMPVQSENGSGTDQGNPIGDLTAFVPMLAPRLLQRGRCSRVLK